MIGRYPTIVRARTTLELTDDYLGYCEQYADGTARVVANRFNLAHEMGHAAAHILGIEQELGRRVWETPGGEVTTNDNPFCYGAQCRAGHQTARAVKEYAADAVAMYVAGDDRLPAPIRSYLDGKWPTDRKGGAYSR